MTSPNGTGDSMGDKMRDAKDAVVDKARDARDAVSDRARDAKKDADRDARDAEKDARKDAKELEKDAKEAAKKAKEDRKAARKEAGVANAMNTDNSADQPESSEGVVDPRNMPAYREYPSNMNATGLTPAGEGLPAQYGDLDKDGKRKDDSK